MYTEQMLFSVAFVLLMDVLASNSTNLNKAEARAEHSENRISI